MDNGEVLVPLFAIIFMFGAPCAVWLISRVLAHQERMEMMRRGIVPPPNARDMRRAMKYGWTPGTMSQGTSNQYLDYPTRFCRAASAAQRRTDRLYRFSIAYRAWIHRLPPRRNLRVWPMAARWPDPAFRGNRPDYRRDSQRRHVRAPCRASVLWAASRPHNNIDILK